MIICLNPFILNVCGYLSALSDKMWMLQLPVAQEIQLRCCVMFSRNKASWNIKGKNYCLTLFLPNCIFKEIYVFFQTESFYDRTIKLSFLVISENLNSLNYVYDAHILHIIEIHTLWQFTWTRYKHFKVSLAATHTPSNPARRLRVAPSSCIALFVLSWRQIFENWHFP